MLSAEDARKKTIDGAINFIEKEITMAASHGMGHIDLENYDDYFITEEVITHFKQLGYCVNQSSISWRK